MSGSLNKVMLIGNLGRDPETRHMANGNKLVTFSIATSERWTDKKSGERKEKTEWHRIVIWDERLADVAEKYLRKGSTVYLEGQLQTRKWSDNAGIERYQTEVVLQRFRATLTMLDGKPREEGTKARSGNDPDPARQGGFDDGWMNDGAEDHGGTTKSTGSGKRDDLDDEIPF